MAALTRSRPGELGETPAGQPHRTSGDPCALPTKSLMLREFSAGPQFLHLSWLLGAAGKQEVMSISEEHGLRLSRWAANIPRPRRTPRPCPRAAQLKAAPFPEPLAPPPALGAVTAAVTPPPGSSRQHLLLLPPHPCGLCTPPGHSSSTPPTGDPELRQKRGPATALKRLPSKARKLNGMVRTVAAHRRSVTLHCHRPRGAFRFPGVSRGQGVLRVGVCTHTCGVAPVTGIGGGSVYVYAGTGDGWMDG